MLNKKAQVVPKKQKKNNQIEWEIDFLYEC